MTLAVYSAPTTNVSLPGDIRCSEQSTPHREGCVLSRWKAVPAVGLLCHSVDRCPGHCEYQLFADGFQFGTVEQTPQGGVGFRGHPDQSDINGWGSTAWENVYVAGPGSGTIDGQVTSAVAEGNGIYITAQGSVPSAAGTVGTWNWNTVISYSASSQNVALNGQTTVALTSALTGDMNLSAASPATIFTIIRSMAAAWATRAT